MKSICCIDDHERCRAGIIELLTELGFDATPFQCAEEFLDANQTFDQIILDVKLPGQSGLELLVSLRDSGDLTPVILYSGSIKELKVARANALSNVSILDKPFKVHELLALLN